MPDAEKTVPDADKTEPEQTPYGQVATPRSLARLRLRAEDCVRRSDDEALLELVAELRTDEALWPHLWAPSAAVAAARSGRDEARSGRDEAWSGRDVAWSGRDEPWELLEEAVAGGFSQPELFEGVLDEHFGDRPGWTALRRRMDDVPPPSLELLDWPSPAPHPPVTLDALSSDREELLRPQLPAPRASAWATALSLLAWVHQRWDHANDHVEDPDAVEVLRRVAAGERFACVEYSIVLGQSLNALRIPARRVHLRQANHHVGVGRGHVVTEAWIDDLAQWVLLDGQNGAYWADRDGRPLGLLDLLERYAAGAARSDMARPDMVGPGPSARERRGTNSSDRSQTDDGERPGHESADRWWTYFAGGKTTGFAWGSTFAPVFQNLTVLTSDRLLRDPRQAYPSLDEVAVGVGGTLEGPRLRLSTSHPYATGFRVAGPGLDEEVALGSDGWLLRRTGAGRWEGEVAVLTPYGAGRPHALTYRAT